MEADKLSQLKAWSKGKRIIDGVPNPFEVQNHQMAQGWAKEAQGFHADTIEHRAMIGNLEAGVRELVGHVDDLEKAHADTLMLLRRAYAPLRNAHRKLAPKHRDVVAWSVGPEEYCPTCDLLRQMQEELEGHVREGLAMVKVTTGKELGR